MSKENYQEIIKKLQDYSQNLLDNAQIGNSKLILAFAEMIRTMGWASEQADTNNKQISNLTDEIKDLKVKLSIYSNKSEKYTNHLIILTWLLVTLTFLLFLVSVLPLWKETLSSHTREQCFSEAELNPAVVSISDYNARHELINEYYSDCLHRFGLEN